jgi:hypothetical protein
LGSVQSLVSGDPAFRTLPEILSAGPTWSRFADRSVVVAARVYFGSGVRYDLAVVSGLTIAGAS